MNVLGKPQTLDAVEILLSDCRGTYIPRDFIANFDITEWNIPIDHWSADACADPDCDIYWDAWNYILDNAYYTNAGNVWFLYQDGDLFAYCLELMTDEEKSNLGFEE